MIDPNVDRSFFEQQSAEREARRVPHLKRFDRDRRAARGDGISDADRRDMAKANQPGASVGDVARGNKVAALVGVDLRTGRPLEDAEVEAAPTPEEIAIAEAKAEGVRLENERRQQIIDQGNQPNASGFQKKRGEWEERAETLREYGASEAEINARRKAFLFGDTFDPFPFEDGGGESPAPTEPPSPEDEAATKRARLEELRKKAGK
jgi:hypothetical protein